MEPNFELAWKFLCKCEFSNREDGGYTNDPDDPGGETRWGVSKRAYPDIDIKSLTKEEAKVIYMNDYWDKMGCSLLEKPLAIAAFDTAVNCGVGRTKKWLSTIDVKYPDPRRPTRELLQRRIAHYAEIIKKNPNLSKYGKGWGNRVNDLSKYVDIV